MTALAAIQTLMIVDDDEADQILCRRTIERSGLVENTISFHYADEALEFLSQATRPDIDCILLDINMPRMSGLEFLAAATESLGAEFAKSVVIMLTTSLHPGDREQAEQHQAVRAFLHKPLTADHLEKMVKILAGRCAEDGEEGPAAAG